MIKYRNNLVINEKPTVKSMKSGIRKSTEKNECVKKRAIKHCSIISMTLDRQQEHQVPGNACAAGDS